MLAGRKSRAEALADYGAFSASHGPAYALLLAAQRLVPRIPPRLFTRLIRFSSRRRIVTTAFERYLAIAPPPRGSSEQHRGGGEEPGRFRSPDTSSGDTASPQRMFSPLVSPPGRNAVSGPFPSFPSSTPPGLDSGTPSSGSNR